MRGAGREDSNLMKHRQENASEDGSRDPGGSILAQLPCPAPVPWRKRGGGWEEPSSSLTCSQLWQSPWRVGGVGGRRQEAAIQ